MSPIPQTPEALALAFDGAKSIRFSLVADDD